MILSKPSFVKWALDSIKADAFLKSSKSLTFVPNIGYLSKKGKIISVIWEKFLTANKTTLDLSAEEKEPQPKNFTKRACALINKHHVYLEQPKSLN